MIALVMPFTARHSLIGEVRFWDQAHTSLYVLIGIVISHFLIQRLSRYPGEDPLSSAVPSVLFGFACVLVLITMGQLAYSRSIILAGFVGTLSWYALALLIKKRNSRPSLLLAQTSQDLDLPDQGSAAWSELASPPQPQDIPPCDGLVIDLSSKISKDWQDFAILCATSGVPIYDYTRTRELMTGEVELDRLEDIGLDALLPARSYMPLKSIIDVAAALILLAPALLIIIISSAAIKIESRGPAIFVQKRTGFRGRQFNCYKLRSMRADAASSGPHYTLDGDPRITRVGSFLRKYRIDELPQIFNILKGEMSWIGPRPEASELASYYEKHIPFYAFRHSVKPGITGWAAIRQGNVSEVDAARTKLGNDFFYIKNLSLGLDAFIAAKTVWIILTGFGSRSGT